MVRVNSSPFINLKVITASGGGGGMGDSTRCDFTPFIIFK